MSGQRQKNRPEQGELAFPTGSRSEAPKTDGKGTETLVAKRKPESLAETERLMEEVCDMSHNVTEGEEIHPERVAEVSRGQSRSCSRQG